MKKQLIAVFITIIFITNALACAYFPRPGYWVSPGEQKAIIFYEDNTETLILKSGFKGNSRDLAWIIPTPTRPEVTKASEKLFMNVDILTRPQYDNKRIVPSIGTLESSVAESGVRVIESKQVDYYDVTVLIATNSQDLVNWFQDNGYTYPEEYSYVLNHYIEKGWYFTTIKVSPEAQGATEVLQDFKEGHATPIKMKFLSDKIIYPLKMSSVSFPPNIREATDEPIGAIRVIYNKFYTKTALNTWQGDARYNPSTTYTDDFIDTQPGGAKYNYQLYSEYLPLTLYVIADSKYDADGFSAQYASWITDKQIKDLGYNEEGEPYINPEEEKYFITRLSANYQKSQMDEDLVLRQADENKKVNAGPEFWQYFLYTIITILITLLVWLFSPLGIIFVAGFLMLKLAKSSGAKTAGKVLSIISIVLTLLTILFLAFFLIVIIPNNSIYISVTLLLTSCAIIISAILLLVFNWKKS